MFRNSHCYLCFDFSYRSNVIVLKASMGKIDKIMPYVFPLIIVALFVLYYFVNPMWAKFPIQCPWYLLTNTQCPACGFQRALHALLNGDLSKALAYNYFFIFSVPYVIMAILSTWYNYNHIFDKLKLFVFHRYTLNCYIVLYFSWWIIRNCFKI